MLEEPIKEGVPPKMTGSVLMCVADTKEEVLDRVKKDVYYTSDVWDKEKVSADVTLESLGGETGWWIGRLLVPKRKKDALVLTYLIGPDLPVQERY